MLRVFRKLLFNDIKELFENIKYLDDFVDVGRALRPGRNEASELLDPLTNRRPLP